MMQERRKLFSAGLVGAVFFGALAILSVLIFLQLFAPKPPPERIAPYDAYDKGPMQEATATASVQAQLDTLLSFGSRFPGQEGFYATQNYIAEQYREAGLEVIEYPQSVVVPFTLERRLTTVTGSPVAGVEIYPFWPAHFQPCVTPPEGIEAELVLVSDEVLLSRPSFRGCIAVLDTDDVPSSFSLNWIKYAQIGFEAVMIANRGGLDGVKWNKIGSMSAGVPVNFVRAAATEQILEHIGERVVLKVRAEWREIPHTILVGVMKCNAPTSDALVLTTSYDACSPLPDLAPGVLNASTVAAHLAFIKGLQPYREQLNRDVFFISYASQVMAHQGADAVSSLLGPALYRDEAITFLRERQRENQRQQILVDYCLNLSEQGGLFSSVEAARKALAGMDAETLEFFEQEFKYILNSVVFDFSEKQLRTRIAFYRQGQNDLTSPEFIAYKSAKRKYDDAMAAAGFPFVKLLAEKPEFILEYGLERRCRKRLEELSEHHRHKAVQIERGIDINRRMLSHKRLMVVGSYLIPADPQTTKGESLSFFMGRKLEQNNYVQNPVVNDILQSVIQRLELPPAFKFENLRERKHESWAPQRMSGLPTDSQIWNAKEYPAFVFINTDRTDSYADYTSPVELPYMRELTTLEQSLRVAGQVVLSMAFGNGTFEEPMHAKLSHISGRVYVANVGRSMVPNYPLKHALIGHKGIDLVHDAQGHYRSIFFKTDVYGRYDLPFAAVAIQPVNVPAYSPEAAGFGDDGLIAYIKDEGPQGQNVYKSMHLGGGSSKSDVNIVVFRASGVSILDLINPQSLKGFSAASFLTKEGLAPLTKSNMFQSQGVIATFLEPDRLFYVALKAGSPDNEMVQTTRAFMLGNDPRYVPSPNKEIDGPGYLVADSPMLLDTPLQIGQSMLNVNAARLKLQNKYGMADERTNAFHDRSEQLMGQSMAPGKSKHASALEQRDAATYTIINHPVLRQSVFEAVVGILWYLSLLVPFVFFFEKLAFGFADIRKQLTAQAVIFLVVFVLLRILHPAFEMIRSSIMILLGFVIMLVSGGITVLFSGKFQENLEELKKQRGQVSAAEANTLGIMGTAFSLGLNNMHRRIVRTGLTCATLVLITFAMICFTSVQSDIVNVSSAIGRAPYQGLLVKRDKAEPISPTELFALEGKYGYRYSVAPRTMLVGTQGWDRVNYRPELEIVYEPVNGVPKKKELGSILTFAQEEPLRDRLHFVASRGWFTKEDVLTADYTPVFISDVLASDLNISPDMIGGDAVLVKVNGKTVRVEGIFSAASLGDLRDLDGRDLLPFDIEGMRTVQKLRNSVLADDKDPRVDPAAILIAPDTFHVMSTNSERRLISVAIAMPGIGYKAAKSEIDLYLEQSGQTTFYGLDDIAYRGRRAREQSFAGLLELIIPLIIAAMTVLNTMRGSVYERRDEIFVYNAVGIAPRYIFGMFISEAFVYAVVGSVLGYILSQGSGRVLTHLGWTGGLNMTFTSISTIYASLAIMAAVFVSTYFPARSAMEIAAPAEDSGWDLPEPDGDEMTFALPFTFGHNDRIAVLAFFHRHFLDFGEGSAGKFFAGEPLLGADEETGEIIPQLTVTIWLKPFDLAVSQRLTLWLPRDPETGEFIARVTLTRLSGTRESWTRLNYVFVTHLRQYFLYWRAVGGDDRKALFAEARELLQKRLS